MSPLLLVIASAVTNAQIDDGWQVPASAEGTRPPSPTVSGSNNPQPSIWSAGSSPQPPVVGITVTALGGITVLVGIGLAIASVATCAPETPNSSTCYGNRDFAVAAGVAAGVGVAFVSAGLVIINVSVAKAQLAIAPTGGAFVKAF